MDNFNENNDNIRTIDLGTNKIFLKREDPFGFIRIYFERGEVPERLKGSFTEWVSARRVVDRYLLDKKKAHYAVDVDKEARTDKKRVEKVEE